jgi:hypothetical protein
MIRAVGAKRHARLGFRSVMSAPALLVAAVFALRSADADSVQVTVTAIAALLQGGKVEVGFCDNRALSANKCKELANAIAAGSVVRLDPSKIVKSRWDSAFEVLGRNCPQRATSIAGLPMTLYDIEADRRLATAFGPFRVFDLSKQESSWKDYSLVLAEGFAPGREEYEAGRLYSWIAAYFIPKGKPCNGYQVAAFFAGETVRPSDFLHDVEVTSWEGKFFLLSFESILGTDLPIYVSVYGIDPNALVYDQRLRPLNTVLGFLVDRKG